MRTFRNQKHMAKFPQHLGKQTKPGSSLEPFQSTACAWLHPTEA